MNRDPLPTLHGIYGEGSERSTAIAASLYLQRRRQRRIGWCVALSLGSFFAARQAVPTPDNPVAKASLLHFEDGKKAEQVVAAPVTTPFRPAGTFGIQRDLGEAVAEQALFQQSRGVYENGGSNSGPIVDTYTANNPEEWCVDFAAWAANAVGVNIPNRSQGGPANTDSIEQWAYNHPSQFDLLIVNEEPYFVERYPNAQRVGPDATLNKGDFILTKGGHPYDYGSWHINIAIEDSGPGDVVHTIGGNVGNQIGNDDVRRSRVTTAIRIKPAIQ